MNSKKQVNIGIIGLGWPGQRHTEAVLASAHARLYAAADTNAERTTAYAEKHPGVKVFGDYEEMLADPELDAVVVCLPNFLHFPATMAALRHGKHVLCEKPPTLNREQMREVRTEADARQLVYAFGRQRRFDGRTTVARETISSGRLGQIYFARTHWLRSRGIPIGIGGWFVDRAKAGGGAVIDIGIHALDAAWFLMGCPRPTTVSAQVSTNFRDFVPPDVHFDVDDTGFAFIRFANGAVMHLEVCWAANLPDDVPEIGPNRRDSLKTVLFGRKATLRVNPLTLFEDQAGTLVDIPMEATDGNGFAEQMEDFAQAVLTGREPTNNVTQALYLMEMLDAMYESSATGREVVIPDLTDHPSPSSDALESAKVVT